MRYDITYRVQTYDFKRKNYRWIREETHIFDFGNTKPVIRNALLELGQCIDVDKIIVNGIPARHIINILMKMKDTTPTERAAVIVQNIDQKQTLKKI